MNDRLESARRRTVILFAIAVGAPVVVGFLWVAAPGSIEPMFNPNERLESIMVAGALAMLVIGEVWVFRIFRRPVDKDPDIWRYRSRSYPITARLMFPGRVNRALGLTPGQFGRYLG